MFYILTEEQKRENKETINKTREYLAQRFTRKEKLQMMTREIFSRLNEDFIRTVKICSLDFHYNFEPDVQKRALDHLATKEKCIKYEVSDIPDPSGMANPACIELPKVSDEDGMLYWDANSKKVKAKEQSALNFIITALPNFEEIAQKICGVGGEIYEMKYGIDTGNVFINGTYITHYRQGSINADIFSYLYSGEYKPGDWVEISTIRAMSRKMAQFKNDCKLEPAIFNSFFSTDGEKLSFFPTIDSSQLSSGQKNALDKAIEATINTNRAVQTVF